MRYTTGTGYYVLRDADGRIGAKANVGEGDHPVPDWVDLDESFDVGSVAELREYDIDSQYIEVE